MTNSIPTEALDDLIQNVLTEARQANQRGDNRKAHGMVEVASQLDELIRIHQN